MIFTLERMYSIVGDSYIVQHYRGQLVGDSYIVQHYRGQLYSTALQEAVI